VDAPLVPADAERLRITSDGKVRVPDDGKFTAGAGDDLSIFHNGTHNFIDSAGSADLYVRGANILLQDHVNSNRNWLIGLASGALELYHSGTKKLETTSGGVTVTGDVSVGDSSNVNFGASSDGRIYYNQSNDIFYIYNNSAAGGTIVQNNSAAGGITLQPVPNENAVFCAPNGRVSLYYDSTEKFRTTTTGARVTGALEVTQEYPTIRPVLDLNFAATKSLDRRITFTRGSLGTYTDENGVLRTASNNVARFDHDPTTGESLGLLIEEVQDNLINYSSEMNLWTKSNCNVTENAVTSPDGTLTADKIALSGVSGYVLRSLTISANSVHTYSVYMKKADNNFGMLRYRWNGSNYDTVNFDLANGTTSRTPAGVSSTSIIDVGNGWYRCIVTFTPTSTTASNFQIKSSSEAQTSDGSSYTGTIDGVRGVYAWGAQVEQGSFASSYIPTSGSTGTRWSDKAKIIGTNFTDFYNQTEGTFSVTAKPNEPNNGSNYYFIFEAANYSNTGNAVSIGKDNGNTYRLRPMKHSNLSDSSVAYTTNSVNIAIAGSGSGDGVAVVNGTVSATSTGAPSGTQDHNVLQIGNRYPGSSGGHYSGTIQSLKYYNKRLPNAQLQGLTQQ